MLDIANFDEKHGMTYDYIFCGFGLSTMLVLEELEAQNLLEGKRLLLLEKEAMHNDKMWCFWEKGPGKWDVILSGKWTKGCVGDEDRRKEILDGFTYKCISAADLRNHTLQKLQTHSSQFKQEQVMRWIDHGKEVSVYTQQQTYTARYFFNSAYTPNSLSGSRLLLQHFEGWHIKTKRPLFNATEATIMDFSVPQKHNTRFMYLLPFSEDTALVEYTLFSPALLPEKEYGQEIARYLNRLGITEFEVTGTEAGIIPMTGHPFWKSNTRNVLHIGTAGGWTKASTGYTFANATKMAQKLAEILKHDAVDFRKFYTQNRFNWYDRIFVEVLYADNSIGKQLLTSLFFKTKSNEMMRFLKDETNLKEEFSIVSSCPKRPFLAALARLIKKYFML